MAPRESRTLEFKEKVTNTFLKTVSAYANYGGGRILFGTKDDGTIAGIENPNAACLDIENRINDSLNPVPPLCARDRSRQEPHHSDRAGWNGQALPVQGQGV